MIVGVCKVKIFMDSIYSLKEKRHIIKSVIERSKARFNISIAEVDLNEKHQMSVIGFCCISNERAHVDSMLQHVLAFLERDGRFEVIELVTESIPLN